MQSLTPLSKTLFACCLSTVLLMLVLKLLPLPDTDQAGQRDAVSLGAIEGSEVTGRNIDSILARPLFNENRRPPAEVINKSQPKQVTRNRKAPYDLVGILGQEGASRTAYLVNKETRENIAVEVGTMLEVWTVLDISQNSIRLEYQGRVQTIEMSVGG